MCILFVHVDPKPKVDGFRMILATNRDEYYKRPSMKAHIDKETNIIGGKDMEPGREGGTWLGFKSKDQKNGEKKHCICVILNVTGAPVENALGRGQIITNYLNTSNDFNEYSGSLDKSNYNGYNFVSVELSKEDTSTYYHSNMPKMGIYFTGKYTLGFGNTPFTVPLHKVRAGRHNFEEILKKNLNQEELEKALLTLLKDETKYLPDEELQRRQPAAYESLSSVYIKIHPPGYGTRTHTLILIDYDWNLKFIEHTMEEPIHIDNPKWTETRIEMRL